MKANTNKGRLITAAAVLLLLAGYVTYKRLHHPHAHTGITVVETDSAIIEVSVTESKDSAGHLRYETTRTVRPKE